MMKKYILLIIANLLLIAGFVIGVAYAQHIHVAKQLRADIYTEPLQMENTYGIQIISLGENSECNSQLRSTLRVWRGISEDDALYLCIRKKDGTYGWKNVSEQQQKRDEKNNGGEQ